MVLLQHAHAVVRPHGHRAGGGFQLSLIHISSGVGKLSDVIRAVQNLHADVELAGFVTVADASKCRLYMKNFGEFYNNQIEHASAIILSRTDSISEDRLCLLYTSRCV